MGKAKVARNAYRGATRPLLRKMRRLLERVGTRRPVRPVDCASTSFSGGENVCEGI